MSSACHITHESIIIYHMKPNTSSCFINHYIWITLNKLHNNSPTLPICSMYGIFTMLVNIPWIISVTCSACGVGICNDITPQELAALVATGRIWGYENGYSPGITMVKLIVII